MRYSLVIYFLLIYGSVFANPYDARLFMFEEGKEVTKTYHQLLQDKSIDGLSFLSRQVHERALEVFDNPNSNVAKERYLSSFPRSFSAFLEIFHSKTFDELYDGFIYIQLVDSLASEYPDKVGDIYVNLASEACLDADASNYLRHNLVVFEDGYPDIYAKYYKGLTPRQQNNIELFRSASIHEGTKGVCNL